MKTITEFAGTTLKNALNVVEILTKESKTPEEIAAQLTQIFKAEGDKLKHLQAAMDVSKGRQEGLKRVVVLTLDEKDKAPQNAEKREENHYLCEFFPGDPNSQRRRGAGRDGFDGRDGRGGGRGDGVRRGGRDGKRGAGGGGRGDGRRGDGRGAGNGGGGAGFSGDSRAAPGAGASRGPRFPRGDARPPRPAVSVEGALPSMGPDGKPIPAATAGEGGRRSRRRRGPRKALAPLGPPPPPPIPNDAPRPAKVETAPIPESTTGTQDTAPSVS